MLKKTIKYEDYNGVTREEDFFFNLSKAEIMEMQMSTAGGLADMLVALIKTQNTPEIIRIFKGIILKAYGEKSADGKYFIKVNADGHKLADDFAQTEAYSALFMELSTDSKAAAAFVNGIIPKDMEVSEEEQARMQKELFGDTMPTEAPKIEATETKAE